MKFLPAPWVSKELKKEKSSKEDRERRRHRERKRETAHINKVITCHAHNSWTQSG